MIIQFPSSEKGDREEKKTLRRKMTYSSSRPRRKRNRQGRRLRFLSSPADGTTRDREQNFSTRDATPDFGSRVAIGRSTFTSRVDEANRDEIGYVSRPGGVEDIVTFAGLLKNDAYVFLLAAISDESVVCEPGSRR